MLPGWPSRRQGVPVIVTETVPLKEFSAAAETLTGKPVAPPVIVSDPGDTANVKSGGDRSRSRTSQNDSARQMFR